MSHAASRFNSDGLQQKDMAFFTGDLHPFELIMIFHDYHAITTWTFCFTFFFILCALRFSSDPASCRFATLKFIACLTHDIPGISSLSALIPARRTLPLTRRPMSNGQIFFLSQYLDLVQTCLLSSTGVSRIWRREVECMKYRRSSRVWGLCRCSSPERGYNADAPELDLHHRWTRAWSDFRHFSGLHCIAISCTSLGCWLSAYLLPEVGMKPVIILNLQKSLRFLCWRGNVGWVLRYWSLPLRWEL